MKVKIQEIRLSGVPISHGISIGQPFFFTFTEDEIPEKAILEECLQAEIERYRNAVTRCKEDVVRLQEQLRKENALEAATILETHLHIIDDPLISESVIREIISQKKNAEFLFHELTLEYQHKFEAMADAFFRERALDLQDISRRIISYLCSDCHVCLSNVPKGSIVFARELAASDVAEVNACDIGAFVTETGGATSHAAIVAKAKGIPYIASVNFGVIDQMDIGLAIVDGRRGEIILNPEEKTLRQYQKIKEQQELDYQNLEKMSSLVAETYDGYEMQLSANVEMVNEVDSIHRYGASGIGLFRSEYIYITQQAFPSEEEQFSVYRTIVEKMKGKSVVIRTFDVGGDKLTVMQQSQFQGNPYLGSRAIRFLLKEQDIFRTQLRAILRASQYGNVKILLPMISGVHELLETKDLIEAVREELKQEGILVSPEIPIGCMIEVPSAAIIADSLASHCDFLSIGTNDLVQYTLAADRTYQAMSVNYSPAHPAVIRLIKLVVTQANQYGIPVAVCGEIAADPKFTGLLIGLGVHELSVASRYLPIIKNAIRSTSIVAASELAEEILTLHHAADILEKLEDSMPK